MNFKFSLFKERLLLTTTFALLLILISIKSHAIHISTYRILLDDEKRNAEFIVSNSDLIEQDCKIILKHYHADDNGKILDYEGNKIPDNSAKPWLRYSPRKFVLTPKNKQTIRFTMRRKPNSRSDEYRSFVSVDCTPVRGSNQNAQLISFAPKIVHTVPLIVRVGDVTAQVGISAIAVNNTGAISFQLMREGNRSIYGNVELIDNTTDEVVSSIRGTSVFVENDHRKLTLPSRGKNPKNLSIRFIEDKFLSGDIVVEKRVMSD